jgi:hypothetical protein
MRTIIMCGAFFLIFLTGCASNSSWRYLDDKDQIVAGIKDELPSQSKAHLVLTTNSWLRTTFYANQGENLCKPSEKTTLTTVSRHGYYEGQGVDAINAARAAISLGLTKVLESDPKKPRYPHVFVQEIDATTPIVLEVSSYGQDGNTTQSCGPVFLKLFPESGKRYRLSMNMDNERCSINPFLVSSEPSPLKYATWSCSPSFLGVGGGEIRGYREWTR